MPVKRVSNELVYPLLPKTTAQMEPGQFWGVPLNNGRFACGRVLSLKTNAEGRRKSNMFLAGLMDWVGDAPPTFDSIAGSKILEFSETHIRTIEHSGGQLRGCRPLALDGNEPGLMVSGWGETDVTRGLVYVRAATEEDRRSLPKLRGMWGVGVIKISAEHRLGTPVDPQGTLSAEDISAPKLMERRRRDLEPDSRDMPFTPKTTAHLRPGDFWAIPLADGRFGCGRVLSLATDDRGKRHALFFLAGIMDWIGNAPPEEEVIAGRKILAFGETHIEGLLQHGRRVLGWRSLEVDDLHPGLMRSGFEGGHLALGLEFLREATRLDKAQVAECPLWNKNGIKSEVKRLLGVACAKPEPPRKKPPARLNFNPSADLDGRAVQILMDAYWSNGWRANPVVAPGDLAHARQAGVMFDPIVQGHDEIMFRIVEARAAVTKEQVADAFLASLSRRRLDLRSALGSYAVFQHMPAHGWAPRDGRPETPVGKWCQICGAYDDLRPHDLNVLNFERFKWGGVRHQNPLYAALDLELLAVVEQPEITPEDVALMRKLLVVIGSLPPDARPRDASDALADVVASNKQERDTAIQILGYCGILQSTEVPGYLNEYVEVQGQTAPRGPENDWKYPVSWWRGSDDINREAVAFWFPQIC